MDFEETASVYALLDSNNYIIRVEGEYTKPDDLSGWVVLETGAPCDRLNLAQSHYLETSLFNDDGKPVYKYSRKKIVSA